MGWDVRKTLTPHLLHAVEHAPVDSATRAIDHAALDRHPHESYEQKVLTHCAPGAFEPLVASLDLMVGLDRSRQGLDLYQVVARTTGARHTGASTTALQANRHTFSAAPIPEPDPTAA